MKKRVRRGDPQRRQQWQAAIWQWQQSGQSVRDFCRTQGLKESALYFWRRELARRGSAGAVRPEDDERQLAGQVTPATKMPVSLRRTRAGKDQARFLPVHVVMGGEQATRGDVEIAMGGNRIVRVQPGFDRQALADVLRLLEGRPC